MEMEPPTSHLQTLFPILAKEDDISEGSLLDTSGKLHFEESLNLEEELFVQIPVKTLLTLV